MYVGLCSRILTKLRPYEGLKNKLSVCGVLISLLVKSIVRKSSTTGFRNISSLKYFQGEPVNFTNFW